MITNHSIGLFASIQSELTQCHQHGVGRPAIKDRWHPTIDRVTACTDIVNVSEIQLSGKETLECLVPDCIGAGIMFPIFGRPALDLGKDATDSGYHDFP